MKKYVVFMCAVLTLFSVSTNAKENNGKGDKKPSIEQRVEKMATDLNLTETEKTAVKSLFEKQDAEKKQFMKDNNKENADFKPKMKELQKKQDAELKAVIGDEKFKKYLELKAEEKKKEKENKTA